MSKKTILAISAMLLAMPMAYSQAQKADYPLNEYTELTDTKPHDGKDVWEKMKKDTEFAWGNIDTRYKKLNVPEPEKSSVCKLKAWKGERVNAQAIVWTKTGVKNMSVSVGDLKNGNSVIPASDVTTNFVRYVMTDELNKDGKSGCSSRPNKADWDSSIVADVLDTNRLMEVLPYSTQPVWVGIVVPRDVKAGKYRGTITVSGEGMKSQSLNMEVEVMNRTLPEPKDWKFHLDLWQNPYSVARYYDVPLWSKEHFDAMRPIMKMLADAGQKVVTATIMQKPWAGQTEDPFDSMIMKKKNLDGTWEYDYTVFDKWIEFMRNDIGIKTQINCYTMIPWALTFDYYDQATNKVKYVNAKPGDASYADYWIPFLKDFSKHLRQKGWFDVTTIAMDERPMEAMKEAIKVIKAADPQFKVSLAGNYHGEIEADLYDLCVAYGQNFPADVKARREKEGKVSTVYTCCAEAFPNMFTFSEPAEAVWTMIHTMAGNYDGYLRWTVIGWTADPLRDSRFRTWAAGDCYSIYPGPRSSIRFERLVEGVQDCEKARIIRDELEKKGDMAKLRKLNEAISSFTNDGINASGKSATEMVRDFNTLINTY